MVHANQCLQRVEVLFVTQSTEHVNSESTAGLLTSRINNDSFQRWYKKKTFEDNIRNGKPYFNGPSRIKPTSQYSPSSLLQCPRKITYSYLNAPEESTDPEGIFWIGSKVETEIIIPYLEAIVDDGEYVTNSIWIDFSQSTDQGEIQFRGETDPVIVDQNGTPLLVTEIKTKRNVTHLDSPDRNHLAQTHAYMKGLSEKFDQNVTDAVIIYCGRDKFDFNSFHVSFDPLFWSDTIVSWAEKIIKSRVDNELPPAKPIFNWECDFCPFTTRCGQTDSAFEDLGPKGFVPGHWYPKNKVIDHVETYEEVSLTPTLAEAYPDLLEDYEVSNWKCSVCGECFDWREVNWNENTGHQPHCPTCVGEKIPESLFIPVPDQGGGKVD